MDTLTTVHRFKISLHLPAIVSLASALLICGIIVTSAAGQSIKPRRALVQSQKRIIFSDLATQQALAPAKAPVPLLIPEGEPPTPFPVPPQAMVDAITRTQLHRPTITPQSAPSQSPVPALSFAGLGDNGLDGFFHIPPDTQGAVGSNHLMVALNDGVLIQNRDGSTNKVQVGLTAFWQSTGATSVFDPKLLYDPFNDRWIFASTSSAASTSSSVLIGVSQTTDPTGVWNLYKLAGDQTAARNNVTPTLWADYPSIGFNKTWVIVTVNMFTISGNGFSKATIFAFDKAGLYAGVGAQSLSAAVFDDTNGFTEAPAVTYDNTLATMYLANRWNGDSGGFGFLRIETITGTVGTESYNTGPFVSTQNPWGFTGSTNFAPQAGGSALIDAGDDRLLKLVYRNGSLWASQSVFLPAASPTRSSAQWWQFLPDATVQQFGRVDDPTNTNFYAYPTIAVNKNSDALVGYAHFSSSIFAEGDYSFRAASDPPSTLQSPVTLRNGDAFYNKTFGGPKNRWGDYSNTLVDPVNDTDMWTIQEYAATGDQNVCGSSSCWGTWWGKLSLGVIVSPASLAFTSQPLGTVSPAQAITVTNGTTATLNVTGVIATPSFTETDNCVGQAIAVNGTCNINVKFAPSVTGSLMGTVTLNDNASATPTIGLSGSSFEARLKLSVVNLIYTSQQLNTTSAGQAVTLTNASSNAVGISPATFGDFAVSANTCPGSLAVGNSCSVTVVFKPVSTGSRTGSLFLGSGLQAVELFGTGTQAGPIGPRINFSAVAMNFGTQALNSTSSLQLTISNSGDTTLNISNFASSAGFGFGNSQSCATLNPAGNCSLNVLFTPTTTGPQSGSLKIADDTPGSPHVIRLFGTGGQTNAPAISFSSISLNFGDQTTGTTSTQQTISVTNSGGSALNITNVSAFGDFSATGCVASLAPQANCTISVSFAPSVSGTRTGGIVINDNASGSPHLIRLFGRGI